MRGPLPKPDDQRRRRNAPTISHRELPADGRQDPAPDLPFWVHLGAEGTAWWTWAWKTPQATAWAPGHEGTVARRAGLEDDYAALANIESLNGLDLLRPEDERAFKFLVSRLAGLATNRLAVAREMRELDDRLGLSPKGMAMLRWRIADEDEVETVPEPDDLAEYGHLRSVDAG